MQPIDLQRDYELKQISETLRSKKDYNNTNVKNTIFFLFEKSVTKTPKDHFKSPLSSFIIFCF